jgi:CrcB protein
MKMLLAVFVGGGSGALLRYWLAGVIGRTVGGPFPWPVFAINVTGSFAMGLLVELLAIRFSVTPETRAFLTVGVLGGYTTFSSFSLDAALLIQRGEMTLAAAYIAGSALLSVAGLFAGLWVVRALAG